MDKVNSAMQVRHWAERLYGRANTTQLSRIDKVIKTFNSSFHKQGCYVCSSSGRVELIGNHTDHNGGKVLACTVDRDIVAGFLPTDDNKVVVKSQGYGDVTFTLDQLDNKEVSSAGMVKGVLRGLVNGGYKIGGMIVYMTSNVPGGAGMSSSAAYQLLVGRIQAYLYNDNNIDGITLARIGQWAENNYFNKPCGLMDQATIGIGGVVRMQFGDNFSETQVSHKLEGHSLVVTNTGGSHANLTDHYASIPLEMKAVAKHFGAPILGQVDRDKFYASYDEVVQATSVRSGLRAKHFFEDDARVDEACSALSCGDTAKLIDIVNASGNSSYHQLQNVTYEGGDSTLADGIAYSEQVLAGVGATRVHGGGFAGTILAVVPHIVLDNYMTQMTAKYGDNNVFDLRIRSVGAVVLTAEDK